MPRHRHMSRTIFLSLRDHERAAVRRMREALGLTRPEFAALLTKLGHKASEPTIESYEKEVPAAVLSILASYAQKVGLVDIAEDLLPSSGTSSVIFRKENEPWHVKLEKVLQDPDERIGIEKNLKWAIKTVDDKPTDTAEIFNGPQAAPKRRAGGN